MNNDNWFDTKISEEDCSTRLWGWVDNLKRDQETRKERADDALTSYLGRAANLWGDSPGDFLVNSILFSDSECLGFNLVASATDTMANQLVNNKVLPLFVTSNGSPEEQKKAKAMNKAIEGLFDANGLYTGVAIDIAYSGLLFEAAAIKVQADEYAHTVKYDKVWAHDIYVPADEARNNEVRTMAHCFTVDRQVLLKLYEDDKDAVEAIKDAKASTWSGKGDASEVSDRVEVVDAWRLPTNTPDLSDKEVFKNFKKHDGVRVQAINGKVLARAPYPRKRFPIAFFKPNPIPGSFWSYSFPQRLSALQLQINRWEKRYNMILDLHAVPRLIVNRAAKLNPGKISNNIADILVSSIPPSQAIYQMVPQSVPREIIERIDKLIAYGKQQVGLNEMSIAAQKPAGINHAPGMQMLADHETLRQKINYNQYEAFYVELAELSVEAIRELAEKDSSFEIMWGNAKEMQKIKWKEIDLGRDKYKLRAYPTNLLPKTPAARLSRIIDMLSQQLINVDQALIMLDFPDIQAILGDRTAEIDNVHHYIEMAKHSSGESVMPHPYLNLELAFTQAKQEINRMEADGAPEQAIAGVMTFIEMLDALRKAGQQQQAQAQQQAPMPQQAPGTPPPQQAPPQALPPGSAPV